jgi:branched-chain amino acid transport system substrate-binding protein
MISSAHPAAIRSRGRDHIGRFASGSGTCLSLSLVALVTLVAIAGCSSKSSESRSGSTLPGPTYVVGVFDRQTGANSDSYKGAEPAAKAWEAWTNSHGGINGHPVKVIVEDSAADPSKGLAVVKDMVENDHVLALIDDDPSVETGILQYTRSNGIALLNSNVTSNPAWTTTAGWFALSMDLSRIQVAALQVAQSSGLHSLAAVVCAELAACGAAGPVFVEHSPKFGITYNGTFKAAASAPDYTAECLALKQKDTESVLSELAGPTGQRFAQDCLTQDYKPTFVVVANGLTSNLLQVPGLKLLAAEANLPWYANAPALSPINAAMKAVGTLGKKDKPAVDTWIDLEAFKQAAASSTSAPTKETVMQGLYGIKDFTAGGLIPPVSFTAGQPSPQGSCYYVAGAADGKFTMPQGTDPKCLS